MNVLLKGISKFIKLGLLASAISIIAGCNGTIHLTSASDAKGYEPVFSGFPLPLFFVASSVQWNEDYAVSAKHTPFLRNIAYSCSTGCDLVFIKRKADNNIPEWRHSIKTLMSDEKLTKTPELIKPSTISYMMQTEIIEREWKLFQEQEQEKNKKI